MLPLTESQKKIERDKIIKQQKRILLDIAEKIDKVYIQLNALSIQIEPLREAYEIAIDAKIELDGEA